MKKNKSSLQIHFNFNFLILSLLLTALLLLSSRSMAWGPLGHKAVCDAAWRSVGPAIQEELARAARRMGYKSYAAACLWPDEIRQQKSYAWVKPLHYMNLPRGARSIAGHSCGKRAQSPKCVLAAIYHYHSRWQESDLSQAQRDRALLFFSHFVGDIHQPLHVSYRDDRGGTRQNITFKGKLMSLHSLWDSDILYCGTRAGWRDLAKQLHRHHKRYSADSLGRVEDWADESFALTQAIYEGLQTQLPSIYCEQYHPIAINRLELASVRLAHLLKAQFLDEQPPSGEPGADKVQSAPNLIERLRALWKSILTLLP